MHHEFPKKTILTVWILGVALLGCIALGITLHVFEEEESSATIAVDAEKQVVVCGDVTLTNTQLGYYFWSEYSYYLMSLGNQIPATLDMSKPLDSQMYDGQSTWQDYILGKTMTTVEETLAMVNGAMEAGFELPTARQVELDSNLADFAEKPLELGILKEDGTADVDGYIQQSYGGNATLESLTEYLYHSYLADAYSTYLYDLPEFTAEEIEDYFDSNGGAYYDKGVYKTDEKLVTIRVVYQSPTNLTDTVAWENAEKSVETLYAAWLAEEGNQDDFAALAAAHSTDATTRFQGGLMEEISPSNVTGEVATWVFEEERVPGDTAVLKSETGWAIVYFVEETDTTLWQKTAEVDLRLDTFYAAFDQMLMDYPTTVHENDIVIVELENYVQAVPNS